MKAAEGEAGKSSARILIVDDEEIVLVALRDTLGRLGYRVTTAPARGTSCQARAYPHTPMQPSAPG